MGGSAEPFSCPKGVIKTIARYLADFFFFRKDEIKASMKNGACAQENCDSLMSI